MHAFLKRLTLQALPLGGAVVFVASIFLVLPQGVHAAASSCPDAQLNARGYTIPMTDTSWAWSSNLSGSGAGWIKFTGTSTDAASTPYAVCENASGNVAGWAWSSNFGWLAFSPGDVRNCPDFPTDDAGTKCQAKDANGKVVGWARFIEGANQSGNPAFDGWVNLGASGSGPFGGVTSSGGCWSGFAWGGQFDTGWISFSGTNPNYSVCLSTAPPPQPELGASDVTPTIAKVGVAVTLRSTITNQGTGATGTGFTDLFQRATDANGTGATDIGTFSSAALAAGGSNTATLSFTFSSAGTFFVRACADKNAAGDAGKIAESNENNNCSANWVAIKVGSPDLITSGVAPTTAVAGSVKTFSATVTNQGDGTASPSFTDTFERADTFNSSTQAVTNKQTIGTFTNPNVSAGGNTTATLNYAFPGADGGKTRFMRVCADSGGTTSDSNPSNNCGAWTAITVAPPPKTVCSVRPDTGKVNTDAFTWTVTPAGGSGTYTQSWTGTDGLTGTAPSITKTYSTTGSKTATVTVTSSGGGVQAPVDCKNSTGASGVTVTPQTFPDLVMATGVTPVVARTNQSTTFSATVTNNGQAGTGTGFTNLFQQATAADGTGAVDIGTAVISGGLAAGASQTITHDFTFQTGTIFMRVCADKSSAGSSGTITESNENNNCGTVVEPWTRIDVSPNAPSCGSATKAAPSKTKPSSNLCSNGNVTSAGVGGPTNNQWTWSCSVGGTPADVSCTAPFDPGGGGCESTGTCADAALVCTVSPQGPNVTNPANETYTVTGQKADVIFIGADGSSNPSLKGVGTYVVNYTTDGVKPVTVSSTNNSGQTYFCPSLNVFTVVPGACSGPKIPPTLTANPARIARGGTANLVWTKGSGAVCKITGTGGISHTVTTACDSAGNGVDTVANVNQQSVYTITCDSDPELTANVTVNIIPTLQEF